MKPNAAPVKLNKLPRNPGDSRDSPSPYGALTFISWNHDWNNNFYENDQKIERAAVLMKEAGILFSRTDFLWSDVEPRKGHFDFSRLDRILGILSEHGIKTLGTLNYNPVWQKDSWNSAPNPEGFVHYARELVRHFRDRVKHWEIWNEPDHEAYWKPQDGMAAYSRLLKRVYSAIKEEDSTSMVLNGGLSDSVKNLRSLYENAGRESFDILNLHPFVNPLVPNALDVMHDVYAQAYAIMKEYGDEEKSIWFTEVGCPGADPANASGGWWAGAVPNEAEQGAWLEAIYGNALAWKGVDKIFWAFFRDTDNHFKNDVDRFGMVRLDFSPKPAYLACKKIALKGPKKN